jgi:hypothetical protein
MRHFICTGLERTMYNFFEIPLWKNCSQRKKRMRQMAKSIKTEHTLVNTRTTLKFFHILFFNTRQVGLSQKTISRYCPFKVNYRTFSHKLHLFYC